MSSSRTKGRISSFVHRDTPPLARPPTGGDATKALLDSLQAQGIEVVDELEYLVPAGVVKSGRWEGMAIITKPGGFGGEDVFLKAVNYLRENKK